MDSQGYSPSASKPEKVVADWSNAGIAIDIRPIVPATEDHLSEVHDDDHVLDVLEGRESNGHGNQILEVSQSCLWTVGSFVAATQEAVRNGHVACSPTSGFHHAGNDHYGGFCTFNGLMVAAHTMIANDVAVAIVDCDRHFGDGTQDIESSTWILTMVDSDEKREVVIAWSYGTPKRKFGTVAYQLLDAWGMACLRNQADSFTQCVEFESEMLPTMPVSCLQEPVPAGSPLHEAAETGDWTLTAWLLN